MAGFTLFTSPKHFEGHIGIIQRNALRSWARLGCQVLVFGESRGAAEICAETGATYLPDVEVNDRGTPLISGLFAAAEARAQADQLCYVNADIILLDDFPRAMRSLAGRRALTIGRRWDLDVMDELDFGGDWQARLRERVARDGRLHDAGGVDYFAFPRGLLGALPPMALGRGYYDMWLIYQARHRGGDVIDATPALTAIHQNHDFTPGRRFHVSDGPETVRNFELTGGADFVWHPLDATHELRADGLHRRRPQPRRWLRRFATLHPRAGLPLRVLRKVVRLVRGRG